MPCLLLFAVVEAHCVFSADFIVLADKDLTLVRQVGTDRCSTKKQSTDVVNRCNILSNQ
jgi:hypothetical protein